jgi:hypothetical protein
MVGSADRCAIAEEIEEIAPHSIILVDEMQSSRREGSTMLEDPNLPVDEREAYVRESSRWMAQMMRRKA